VRVIAPGKLLLAGAYAVLEGAPALVVGVDRHAVADGARRASRPTPEVLAAMSAEDAPEVDASALREDGQKLGLGSSAAMLVASLGVLAARRGEDLAARDVRDTLFDAARRAHAAVQDGGSGADVAASVHGGALSYTLSPKGARVVPVQLPADVVIEVFWCGSPALTTGMRARVEALRERNAAVHAARLLAIADASVAAIIAAGADDARAFVAALGQGADALVALGRDADSPIVPPAQLDLVRLAAADGGAFLPSGAGGGDVFVHVAPRPAPPRLRAAAEAAGMRHVPIHVDRGGVRLVS